MKLIWTHKHIKVGIYPHINLGINDDQKVIMHKRHESSHA